MNYALYPGLILLLVGVVVAVMLLAPSDDPWPSEGDEPGD